MAEFNDLKSYAIGYLSAPITTGIITPGTPVKLDVSDFVLMFEQNFEISGGNLVYTGTPTVQMDGKSSVSMSANTNNTVVTFYRGVNGVYVPESALIRKIVTGGDIGALALVFGGQLSTGEAPEIWVDSSLGGTVTIEKINFSIENITL